MSQQITRAMQLIERHLVPSYGSPTLNHGVSLVLAEVKKSLEEVEQANNLLLLDALKDTLSHLVAATSAYSKYAHKKDPFYSTMVSDYTRCADRTRELLKTMEAK